MQPDEESARKKIQIGLERPYGFLDSWKTEEIEVWVMAWSGYSIPSELADEPFPPVPIGSEVAVGFSGRDPSIWDIPGIFVWRESVSLADHKL